MYVRLKNGNIYAAGPENDGTFFIYTLYAEKADGSFEKTEHGYRKMITLSDDEVGEYFALEWKIRLDVGIEGVPDEWVIGSESDPAHGKAVLRFTKGNLPGWTQEDRGVCSREYDFGLSDAWWMETFTVVRNGAVLQNPERKRTSLSKEEFLKLYGFYNSRM